MSTRKLTLAFVLAAFAPAHAATVSSRVLVLDRAASHSGGGWAHRHPVRHALDAVGIAYDEVAWDSAEAALDPATHPVAVINAYLDDGDVPVGLRHALEAYVSGGGTLFATQVGDPGLQALFGVSGETRTRDAFEIAFLTDADPVLFARHDRPEERTIRLADPAHFAAGYDRVGVYTLEPDAVALAWLYGRDGALHGTCMVRRDLGAGHAYLLGLTFFTGIMRPEANRDAEAQRTYINAFEPGADAIRLLFAGLLDRATGGHSVRKHGQPGLFDTALLITHDWDSFDAFNPGEWGEPIGLRFAALEAELGLPSLNLLTTKFVSDEQSIEFWRPQLACDAAGVAPLEFGSHSVAHRTDFQVLPAGSRDATCADYDPDTPSVNDEIRCSKERIELDLPPCLGAALEPPIDSFRAGFLQFPTTLPQELEAAGYRYDFTRSAPDVLTYFPYRLMHDSLWNRETEVLELPLAADDVDLGPGDPRHVVYHWRETMKAVAANGAPFVLLIHPSRGREPHGYPVPPIVVPEGAAPGDINPDPEFKLQAEAAIARFARDRGWPALAPRAWGERWRERERVALERATFDDDAERFQVRLRNHGTTAARDVTLEFGRPVRLEAVPPLAGATAVACRRVWIERIAPGAVLDLRAVPDTDDADGDGTVDACDNCPAQPNADQADFDGDGSGDPCEEAGDVDRSGRVDGTDLGLLAAAFGSVTLEPHYHEASDLTRDARIDGADLAALAVVHGSDVP